MPTKRDFPYIWTTWLPKLLTSAARVNRTGDERDQRWTMTIRPSSSNAIHITVRTTTDCEDDGAICTSDGRMLSSQLTLTVEGPP